MSAKSMHILWNYECNHDKLKDRHRSRSISPKHHDANKRKHYQCERYGNCKDLYGEHSRKSRRLKCESGFENTSSYDERHYRISRSRSKSKPPVEGNKTDELK